MKKNNLNTPEFYDRIAKLRRSGMTVKQIAEEVNCAPDTIAKKLKKRGFTLGRRKK